MNARDPRSLFSWKTAWEREVCQEDVPRVASEMRSGFRVSLNLGLKTSDESWALEVPRLCSCFLPRCVVWFYFKVFCFPTYLQPLSRGIGYGNSGRFASHAPVIWSVRLLPVKAQLACSLFAFFFTMVIEMDCYTERHVRYLQKSKLTKGSCRRDRERDDSHR